MKIVINSGKRLEWKINLEIPDEDFKKIERMAEKYGFRTEEAVKILITGDFIEDKEGITDGRLKELEVKMNELERKLYELEGKWSPLKFKTYYLAMDNRNICIQLAAMIAQNKRLREKLGLPPKDYTTIIEKIHYYLNFGESNPEAYSEDRKPTQTPKASRVERSSSRRSV